MDGVHLLVAGKRGNPGRTSVTEHANAEGRAANPLLNVRRRAARSQGSAVTPEKAALLADLSVAAAAFQAARRALDDAVERARGAGASWSEVGQVVGMTRQGAFQRFGAVRSPNDKPDLGKSGHARPPRARS